MGESREPTAEFVRVARFDDLVPGRGTVVQARGIRVALFLHEDGTLYALRNQCPHMGGELGEGELRGDIVTCPWHGWRFNVKTGKNVAADVVAVRTFPTRVEGNDVYVGV
jgi:nitrite reductase/ring-hydroxylating ferredoxin subunit